MSRLLTLLQTFVAYSTRPCLEGPGFSCSYADLLDETRRWKAKLDTMRIGAGLVMGLRADYSVSAVAAFLALLSRGVFPALIPSDREAAAYCEDAHACGLLDISPDGAHRFEPITRQAKPHDLLDRVRAAGEPAFVIFTSGYTGRPKPALHSLERFLRKFEHRGRSLRTFAFLLFDHVAGLDTLFYTLANGGTLVLSRHRDPRSVLELIASHHVEVLPTSPSFLRLVCALQGHQTVDLSSLKFITYGSEPMDAGTLKRLNERLPGVRIIQKYGTTEAGSPRTESRGNHSLWLKIKGDMETKVIDGVLWLRGEGTMLGYLNAASPVADDGWYCTGDLVEVDGEWIRFCGRTDEMIKVGGEKVSPAEVERVIRELEFVRDAAATGQPHPFLGQVVAARVLLLPSTDTPKDAAARIRQHCRNRLGAHHVPVSVEVLTQGPLLPLTSRHKIARH
jgi:long-chain acyl-CoA synthetase